MFKTVVLSSFFSPTRDRPPKQCMKKNVSSLSLGPWKKQHAAFLFYNVFDFICHQHTLKVFCSANSDCLFGRESDCLICLDSIFSKKFKLNVIERIVFLNPFLIIV